MVADGRGTVVGLGFQVAGFLMANARRQEVKGGGGGPMVVAVLPALRVCRRPTEAGPRWAVGGSGARRRSGWKVDVAIGGRAAQQRQRPSEVEGRRRSGGSDRLRWKVGGVEVAGRRWRDGNPFISPEWMRNHA